MTSIAFYGEEALGWQKGGIEPISCCDPVKVFYGYYCPLIDQWIDLFLPLLPCPSIPYSADELHAYSVRPVSMVAGSIG